MISFLSRSIALFLRDNEIVDEETSQVCQYGFEIIISTLVGFMFVIFIGLGFSELPSAVLFYTLFVGVRLSTGGFHAATHFKCKMVLCGCCLFTVLISKYLIDYYTFVIQSIIVIAYLITVILLSPIEHPNAPVDEFTMKRNRRVSIVISFVLAVVITLGYNEFKKMVMVTSLTLLVVSFLMVLPKLKEKEETCDE